MKWKPWLVLLPWIATLAACVGAPQQTADGYPVSPIDVSDIPDAVPRWEPRSKYGNSPSYEALGQTYVTLNSSSGFVERGVASFYGTKFDGQRTSSGENYDMYKMTAAHKTLPLPTYVQVINLENGKAVVVKVNDRGPFHANRIMDLSYAAAAKLGIAQHGTGLVEIRAVDPKRPPDYVQKTSLVANVAVADGVPRLYVQAGAFSTRDNAERLRSTLLETRHHNIVIRRRMGNGVELFKVYLGPMDNVAQADELSDILQREGIADAHTVVD